MTAHDSIPLFRPEVSKSKRARLAGEVILAHPVRAHVLTGLLVLIFALATGWMILGSYTRSETAPGVLVTDQPSAQVIASRPGRLTQLHVREGDQVQTGQLIATVLVEQPDEIGGSATGESIGALDAQRALAERQAYLATERAKAEKASVSATLDGLRTQQSDVAVQIALQEEIVQSARQILDRLEPVMERGFVSRLEFERRRQLLLSAQQQLIQLQQQSKALLVEERRAISEIGRIYADAGSSIASAQSSVQTFTLQRAQALAARAYAIEAPISGLVAALHTARGRSVEPSRPLLTIIPNGSRLHAEVYAPSRAVGFVRTGQEVRLLYDAFPYQRFGSFTGRVIRVSGTAIDPRELTIPIGAKELVYRIDVELDRQSVAAFRETAPLQPGMTLNANLILERRSFVDWLLRPVNAAFRRNQ